MLFFEKLIHILYFVMAGLVLLCFLKHLFKRKKNNGIVFDIMYAYCCIPFLLRILYIK
ncbi:MAG: hypothetical protein M0Q94_09995 [Candidatus Cloacimonetes bacterium]|nr:hypothetical protein [Candidatus Cloacimonadota bacterium]